MKKNTALENRLVILLRRLKSSKTILSDADFCDNIGLDRTNFPKIKKGAFKLTLSQVISICESYNVNANWLLGLDESPVFRTQKGKKKVVELLKDALQLLEK